MPATDYRRRQAVMVSAGGHALRERARTDPDPVQIRELSSIERARVRAGGPSGIRELRERFESILSELAELRAHRGDAERAELELRNELETTRAQLSNAVTQLGTTRDQLTAARADADAARTDAAASAARAQRFEDRLTETMASAARAEHVEAELAQAVVRAERAEAQVEIALRSKSEPVAPVAQEPAPEPIAPAQPVAREPVAQEPIAPVAKEQPAPAVIPSLLEQIAAEVDVDDAPAEVATPQPPASAPAPSAPVAPARRVTRSRVRPPGALRTAPSRGDERALGGDPRRRPPPRSPSLDGELRRVHGGASAAERRLGGAVQGRQVGSWGKLSG